MMPVLEIKQLQSNDSKEYPLNNMDDVADIAEQYPSMGRQLAKCPDMDTIVKAMLSYLNSHGSIHAKIIGKVNESSLKKSEMDFPTRFDAWLAERGENHKLYDTGWNADPGNQRKQEKKQSWLKSLFSKVGFREN